MTTGPGITPQLEAAARELHQLSCSSCSKRRAGQDPSWACDGEWRDTEIELARSMFNAARIPTDQYEGVPIPTAISSTGWSGPLARWWRQGVRDAHNAAQRNSD